MKITLVEIYHTSLSHREKHDCGGVPYQHGDMLTMLSSLVSPQKVLELGTGLGYTAGCVLAGAPKAQIATIDQDPTHVELALKNWNELGIANHINSLSGKAEEILPNLSPTFDLIFFDGYAPSMKFLIQFERLLRKGGVLITANLFLQDPKGGKYLRALKKPYVWQTALFDDTAISIKVK